MGHTAYAQQWDQTAGTSSSDLTRTGYTGIGSNLISTPLSKFEISNNSSSLWNVFILNGAGSAKGVRIKGGFETFTQPLLQIEANNSSGDNTIEGNVRFLVLSNGNVGIGVTSPTYKLDVCGDIRSKKLRIESGWCDYVFEKGYKLTSLGDLEKYISTYNHLPGLPTTKEVELNGVDVAETQTKLLEKIEELTLYVIQLQNQVNELKNIVNTSQH